MMEQTPAIPFPALSTLDRARAMAAVVLCGVVILAGATRLMLAPQDPEGCLSVLSSPLGWLIIPLTAVLAFILAILVTWLSDAKLEELGLFAVCVGMALASMRYENASSLWLELGRGSDTLRRELAVSMTFETLAWLAVMAAAYAGCLLATRRMKGVPQTPNPRGELQRGLLTVLCMGLIAAVLIPVLSSGTELAPIETGQVYFACAAAFYVAGLIAYQLTAAHSAVWAYLTVALVALGGCIYTIIHPAPSFPGRQLAHVMQLPPTDYARALPIQMVSVGLAAAVFGNWHQRQLTRFAIHEQTKSA